MDSVRPRLPFLAILATLALAAPAEAATFDVTRPDDPVGGTCIPSSCSLRQAISAANLVSNAGSTVNVPAGTYHLTITGSDEDVNMNGDLDLNEPMTIQGAGANVTIIDASMLTGERVFDMVDANGTPPAGTFTLSGLTITGGNGAISSGFSGAGIRTASVDPLQVVNSTVSGNTGDTSLGFGGGIQATNTVGGAVTITGSTFSGNMASAGGGIWTQAPTLTITNSTISGNQAPGGDGGGIVSGGATVNLTNSTVAFNTAATDNGGGLNNFATLTVKNSIVSNNTGGNCNPSQLPTSNGNNVEDGSSCGFTKPTDHQKADPQLAPLAYNGGPTQTHAIPKGSPAVDAGENASCPLTDQRGLPRPFDGNDDGLAVCDAGAYELRGPPPVATTGTAAGVSDAGAMVNGIVNPSGFLATYHFEYGATTAYGGTTPAQTAGAGNADQPVAATISGLVQNTLYHYRLVAVGAGGMSLGADATFTTGVSPPAQGISANAGPVSGDVFVALPLASGARARVTGFAPLVKLTHKIQIPIGSLINTKAGVVNLTTATNTSGGTQAARFSQGVFVVQQSRTNPLTTAVMTGGNLGACSKLPRGGAPKQVAGARSRRSRKLFANVHGRFTSRGRNSAATARGTEFLVKDTCAGTTTVVKSGVVSVRDFTLRKTVKVKAGHKYLARAPKRRGR